MPLNTFIQICSLGILLEYHFNYLNLLILFRFFVSKHCKILCIVFKDKLGLQFLIESNLILVSFVLIISLYSLIHCTFFVSEKTTTTFWLLPHTISLHGHSCLLIKAKQRCNQTQVANWQSGNGNFRNFENAVWAEKSSVGETSSTNQPCTIGFP